PAPSDPPQRGAPRAVPACSWTPHGRPRTATPRRPSGAPPGPPSPPRSEPPRTSSFGEITRLPSEVALVGGLRGRVHPPAHAKGPAPGRTFRSRRHCWDSVGWGLIESIGVSPCVVGSGGRGA